MELAINPIFAVLAISATVCYGWTANYLRAKLPFVAAIDATTVTYTLTGGLSALLLVAWPGFLSKVAATPVAPSVTYLVATSLCSVFILLGYYKLIHRQFSLGVLLFHRLRGCQYLIARLVPNGSVAMRYRFSA